MGENGRADMPQNARTLEAPFTDVPGALADIRAGRMVVVVDDEDRENEGDLTLASEFVTPEAINFMARYGRGLICLTLTEERADYLRLFSHDPAELIAFWHGVYRDHRSARRGHDRHFSGGPGSHHSYRHRPRSHLHRSGATRPCVSTAGSQGRRSGARRADGSLRRLGAPGRPQSLRGDLRNHARRRRDGAHSGPDSLLQGARAANFDRGRVDPLSPAPRALHRPRRRVAYPDALRRVPHDCL